MTFELIGVPARGTEDVVVATHGRDKGAVFTGTEDGSIWRIVDHGRRIDRVAHTGGRPLGIEYDVDGRLVVCDGERGLLHIDPGTGAVEVLANRVGGVRMRVCDNAARPPACLSGCSRSRSPAYTCRPSPTMGRWCTTCSCRTPTSRW